MRQSVLRRFKPRLRAASSKRGLICSRPVRTVPNAWGKEAHTVAKDEHGQRLIQDRRIVGAEEDQAQGDHDAGQGIAKVGRPSQPAAVAARKADRQVGHRQRTEHASRRRQRRSIDAVGGRRPDGRQRFARCHPAQQPEQDDTDRHEECSRRHSQAEQ